MNVAILAIGAAIAVFTGVGAALGIGIATKSAVDAVARQPEADGSITKLLMLGAAQAEVTPNFGFLVASFIILLLA